MRTPRNGVLIAILAIAPLTIGGCSATQTASTPIEDKQATSTYASRCGDVKAAKAGARRAVARVTCRSASAA